MKKQNMVWEIFAAVIALSILALLVFMVVRFVRIKKLEDTILNGYPASEREEAMEKLLEYKGGVSRALSLLSEIKEDEYGVTFQITGAIDELNTSNKRKQEMLLRLYKHKSVWLQPDLIDNICKYSENNCLEYAEKAMYKALSIKGTEYKWMKNYIESVVGTMLENNEKKAIKIIEKILKDNQFQSYVDEFRMAMTVLGREEDFRYLIKRLKNNSNDWDYEFMTLLDLEVYFLEKRKKEILKTLQEVINNKTVELKHLILEKVANDILRKNIFKPIEIEDLRYREEIEIEEPSRIPYKLGPVKYKEDLINKCVRKFKNIEF